MTAEALAESLRQRAAVEWREGNESDALHDLLREAAGCILSLQAGIDDADKRAVELKALLQDASIAVKVRVMQLAHADTATARHVRDLDTKIDRCLGVGQGDGTGPVLPMGQ